MQTQSRNKVESIFFQAIQAAAGVKRDALLDSACGGDSALRHEVELLIAAHQAPDSFLQAPVDALTATPDFDVSEREGSTIGRYKLLEKLGEGGFGLVFMAEQTSPVRRRVALKIIKPGMDSKEVVARFEAERQALAMMDHPNIAKVLDAGTTETGRPYFVMELVKGASITEYCDANRLGTRGRLELFQQVCRAIQHAHQKGVIHRDLKPNNVMVTLHDGVPVPKVIDFGVSKALSQPLTEKTLFTRYGQIVGTPQYMSPEQAEMSGLDVDTRSDVYSLGVLLYELLTGQPPFDADTLREAGFDGMRRIIREQEPVKPSTVLSTLKNNAATLVAGKRSLQPHALRQSVAGDLDWIVMKNLEKDRNRRYETASDLSRDIDRHLANEPIKASPPSFAYQLKKLYHRNRVAVGTFAAIASSLLIGIVFTTIAWANENQQRQIADEQREVADQQRVIAQANEVAANERALELERETKKARKTIEVFQRLLAGASPGLTEGPDATVRSFLTIFTEDLDKSGFDEPEVEQVVRESLGAAYQRFSDDALAANQFEKAVELSTQLGRDKTLDHARLLCQLARLTNEESDALFEQALNTAIENKSPTDRIDILVHWGWQKHDRKRLQLACELVDSLAENERRSLQVNPYAALSDRLEYSVPEECLSRAKQAVEFAKAYLDQDQVVQAEICLAWAWRNAGNLDSARTQADKAIDLALQTSPKRLVEILGRRLELELFILDRSERLAAANKVKSALEGSWSETFRNRGGAVLGSLIRMLLWLDDEEGAAKFTQLIDGLHHAQRLDAHDRIADAYRELGQYANADRKHIELIGMRRQQLGSEPRPSEMGFWFHVMRGRCSAGSRRFDEAINYFKTALAADGGFWSDTWVQFELATYLEQLGKKEESQQLYAKVTETLTKYPDLYGHPYTASVNAWSMLRLSDPDMAAVRDLLADGNPIENLDIARCCWHVSHGLLAEAEGDTKTAIKHYRLAMQNRPCTYEQFNADWIPDRFVELVDTTGNQDLVITTLQEAIERRDKRLKSYHPERAYTRIRLAKYLLDRERDLALAGQLLTEAKTVYAYHSDWIPQKEHETLASLMQKASEFASSAKEER